MSVVPNSGNGKVTVPDLLLRKTPAAGSPLQLPENHLPDGV